MRGRFKIQVQIHTVMVSPMTQFKHHANSNTIFLTLCLKRLKKTAFTFIFTTTMTFKLLMRASVSTTAT